MYDESTIFIPVSMSSEDYFVILQMARRKGMTRNQFIMECVKEYILREQNAMMSAENTVPDDTVNKSDAGDKSKDGGKKK